MPDRRSFLVSVAALGTAIGVHPQPVRASRIGWVSYTPPGVALEAFQDGMRGLGYSGRDAIGIEVRVVEPHPDHVRAAIEELQTLPVMLIFCQAAIAPAAHRINAGRVLLTQAMNGAAVAAVIAPIAIQTAQKIGADPRAMAMGVALATSMAFMTPLGHAVNVLVMGPGGYAFRHYFKVGWLLTLLLFGVIILLFPLLWPLTST